MANLYRWVSRSIVVVVALTARQVRLNLVDATHKESGKLVYIKEVKTDSEEYRIAQLLTHETTASPL